MLTTSGTSIDFTGIPAGVKRVKVTYVGISLDAATQAIIQLGDSGGFETSNYLGSAWYANTGNVQYTNGFLAFAYTNASYLTHGTLTLDIHDSAAFTWSGAGTFGPSNVAAAGLTAGSKSLSGELTQIRLTSASGTANFDAGSIAISWEF